MYAVPGNDAQISHYHRHFCHVSTSHKMGFLCEIHFYIKDRVAFYLLKSMHFRDLALLDISRNHPFHGSLSHSCFSHFLPYGIMSQIVSILLIKLNCFLCSGRYQHTEFMHGPPIILGGLQENSILTPKCLGNPPFKC